MKILWLCNVELPIISNHLNKQENVYGGWLDIFSRRILSDNELYVLYPREDRICNQVGNLRYCQFSENDCESFFEDFLNQNTQFDIIHIWGTELHHSKVMVEKCKAKNLLDNVVVSIQGLISICSYHYCLGLPEKLVFHKTFHEWLRGGNINAQRESFKKRGADEEYCLKNAKNFIGRTDWDKSCLNWYNPNANYFFCNESLREVFYEGSWDYNKAKKYSIFVSQSNYPVKGFHLIIKALAILKRDFPNVTLYTTGTDIKPKVKDKLRVSSYNKYIYSLLQENDLLDNVVFLGTLNADEMKHHYLNANVFVSPSTIENSPNSVGEAMILGCPVISSDVGGVKNMLTHGDSGLIYPSDEFYMLAYYIKKIFNDSEYAIELGKNAKEKAMITHDVETNYSTLLSIYKEIANNENN